MNYLFISFKAIEEFASNRFFQSIDFEKGRILCDFLSGRSLNWNNNKIRCYISEKNGGAYLYTYKDEKKKGILFDMSTFDAFSRNKDADIITIFHKTIKYAVRYFNGHPLGTSDRNVGDNTTIVFPFPYVATHNVYKVCIDRNSSKQNRADQDYLTVFYSGTDNDTRPSFTNLNKAVNELKDINFLETQGENENHQQQGLLSTSLGDSIELKLESSLGYENWQYYLTDSQKEFVSRDVLAAERLEGAAGTGKTLAMVLRAIYLLNIHSNDEEYRVIFITHSLSTKNKIIDVFKNNCPQWERYLTDQETYAPVSITITTLQEWSANSLGSNSVSEQDYLDLDAYTSKGLQGLYIMESVDTIIREQWYGFKQICSQRFVQYIENLNENESALDLFQYELSVVVKGRAAGSEKKYKTIQRPTGGLPIENEGDRSFVYAVYDYYQQRLADIGQFDSDDITLTALGFIETPIWQRRRSKEGFDVCFVDETQLFNFNELCVFHNLNKPTVKNRIVFAMDMSQTLGRIGFINEEMRQLLGEDDDIGTNRVFNTIFRSSPEISELALHVLTSNSTLFHSYNNPDTSRNIPFSGVEVQMCEFPKYVTCVSDVQMIEAAFFEAESYLKKHSAMRRSDVLIVSTVDEILDQLRKYIKDCNKPALLLQSRADYSTVDKAIADNKYVCGGIDYVGGLEFAVVILVGVDKGRFPVEGDVQKEAIHFVRYAAHSRFYVALTRAKYAVVMLGLKSKGISPMLEYSEVELFEIEDCKL